MTWTSREKILATLFVVSVIISAALFIYTTYRIRSVGRIKAVGCGVFWDPKATDPVTLVDWGLIGPGELKGFTVYIKNTRNVNMTLELNTTDWLPPEAAQYLTLDWNYTDALINPEQIIVVQFTLYVSLDIRDVDTFEFTILITALEA